MTTGVSGGALTTSGGYQVNSPVGATGGTISSGWGTYLQIAIIVGGIIYSFFQDKEGNDFEIEEITFNNFSRNMPVPLCYGTNKYAGTLIAIGETGTKIITTEVGGKGGMIGGLFAGGEEVETLYYTASFCVAFSEGEISGFGTVFLDDSPLMSGVGDCALLSRDIVYTSYLGTATQTIDPDILEFFGASAVPWRYTAYLFLSGSIGQQPQLPVVSAEVVGLLTNSEIFESTDWYLDNIFNHSYLESAISHHEYKYFYTFSAYNGNIFKVDSLTGENILIASSGVVSIGWDNLSRHIDTPDGGDFRLIYCVAIRSYEESIWDGYGCLEYGQGIGSASQNYKIGYGEQIEDIDYLSYDVFYIDTRDDSVHSLVINDSISYYPCLPREWSPYVPGEGSLEFDTYVYENYGPTAWWTYSEYYPYISFNENLAVTPYKLVLVGGVTRQYSVSIHYEVEGEWYEDVFGSYEKFELMLFFNKDDGNYYNWMGYERYVGSNIPSIPPTGTPIVISNWIVVHFSGFTGVEPQNILIQTTQAGFGFWALQDGMDFRYISDFVELEGCWYGLISFGNDKAYFVKTMELLIAPGSRWLTGNPFTGGPALWLFEVIAELDDPYLSYGAPLIGNIQYYQKSLYFWWNYHYEIEGVPPHSYLCRELRKYNAIDGLTIDFPNYGKYYYGDGRGSFYSTPYKITHEFNFSKSGGYTTAKDTNPIEVVYNFMTHPRYGLALDTNIFDGSPYIVDSGTWNTEYNTCMELIQNSDGTWEPRYLYSNVFLERQKAYDIIKDVLQTCIGYLYYCDGKIKVGIEKPNEVPILYFGNHSEYFLSINDDITFDLDRIYFDLSSYPTGYWKGDEGYVQTYDGYGSLGYGYTTYGCEDTDYLKQLFVVIDNTTTYIELAEDLPVGVINNSIVKLRKDNIKQGSFTYGEKSHRERSNRIQLEYIKRDDDYRLDILEQDDVYDIDVLSNGEIREKTYQMPGIKRETQARRLLNFLNDYNSIVRWKCDFNTDIVGMFLCYGGIIAVTRDELDWFAKPFRITRLEENPDFEVSIGLIEYISSLYNNYGSDSYNIPEPITIDKFAIPEQVTNLHLFEECDNNIITIAFAKPEDDSFWVGAYIYHKRGEDGTYEFIGVSYVPTTVVQLSSNITSSETIIYYDDETLSGDAFPSSGSFWIEDEEIHYTGIDTINNCFLNCERGYNNTIQEEHTSDFYCILRKDNLFYFRYIEDDVWATHYFKAVSITAFKIFADGDGAPEETIEIFGCDYLPYPVGSLKGVLI